MATDTRMPPTRSPEHDVPREGSPDQARATPWGQVAGLALGLALLLGVVLTAFAWPNVNTAPRDVPVVVAGPPAAVEQLAQRIAAGAGAGGSSAAGGEAAAPFAVTAVPDRAAAERAVLDREAYGGVVLGPEGVEVLVASAASPAIAQALGELAQAVPAEIGGPASVTDLVPLPPDDPRGVGLASAVLPLVIGGLLAGAASALRVTGTARQVATVLAVAVVAGLVLTALLQTWLGALAGPFWANAGVLALGIAAIGTTLLGLHRLLGHAGLGLGAATMVLLGNPLSGVMTAPELLPAGWGQLGQWLPPGATGTALRSVAWFDGAGSGAAFLVLGIWLALGLGLTLLAVGLGRRAAAHRPA